MAEKPLPSEVIVNETSQKVVRAIFDKPGFSTDLFLTPEELDKARLWTTHLWLRQIEELYPAKLDEIREAGLVNYHEFSGDMEHSTMWTRAARCFPPAMAVELQTLPFFRKLEGVFGPYLISDYANCGYADFTWRLCRPEADSDVGPLHTDGSFWRIDGMESPAGYVRLKCWVALHNEPGLSGLLVVPNSHRHKNPYKAVTRHGRPKPELLHEDAATPILPLTQPGGVILFHDNLLHGGAVGRGTATRVSLEFTLFARREVAEPFLTSGTPPEVDYDATVTV